MSTDPKRKMDDRITNDASKDGKKPKIDTKVILHPLPPTATKEWEEQDWEIDQMIDDPQQIIEFKKKNNIDASQQIDMIIPGSYVKWGDPIGGDCGFDTTNGPVRCYPCRCYTQLFTNLHGTSSIRKEVWIDEAMNLVVEQKEFADDEDFTTKQDQQLQDSATAFYNAVKNMKRSDFEDVYDANFSDVPSYFWSNGVWHKDEIIIDCGAIIPCKHCDRTVLALGLKDLEICSNNQEDVALIPFINYLFAMLPSYERMEEFDHYYFRHRIGSKGFKKNAAFLKNAIANDSLSNIDEIVQKRIEARRIRRETYQRMREEREKEKKSTESGSK